VAIGANPGENSGKPQFSGILFLFVCFAKKEFDMVKKKILCLTALAGRFFLGAALILALAYTACEQPNDPGPQNPPVATAALSDVVIDGTAGSEIEGREFTIILSGTTLSSPITESAVLTSWVTNLPVGLTARAKDTFPERAGQVIMVIEGTPETASAETVAVTIPGAFLTGLASLTAQENANARFAIAPPVTPDATVANITISGERESPITEREVVITLHTDTLKESVAAGTVVTWIANLPNGLSQEVKEAAEAEADTIGIRVFGTPQETKSDVLRIVIPGSFLTKDTTIEAALNENARIEIIDSAETRTATVADVLIRGAKNFSTLGEIAWVRDVAIEPQDVIIAIINDTLKTSIPQGEDLSGWIRNLPSGLEAKAKDTAAADSAGITITVSGKPTSAMSAPLAIRIPAAALANSAAGNITAVANSDARFYIVDILAELPRVPSDLPIGVALAAGTTVLGTKGSPIAEVDVVITLTNDTFVKESITLGPAEWITNLPAGLEQQIKSVGGATVTLRISGTPTAGGIAKIMEITIPGSALACGVPVQTVPEISAKYAIANMLMTKEEARTMIPITGGTVTTQPTWVYGAGTSSTGFSREAGPFAETWLPVTVPDFKIGKYPVTEELWYEVYMWARAQGGGAEYNFGGYLIYTDPIPDRVKFFPKYRVSPSEALVWCNAYSLKNGEQPAYYNKKAVTKEDGNIELNAAGIIKRLENAGSEYNGMADIYVDMEHGYRLPVPSEWQYAARGGVINGPEWDYRWPGTNTLAEVQDYGWINELRIYSPDHNMIPVGILKPNAAGLHDLIGAVREWMGRMDTKDPSRCMTMGGQYNSNALGCAFDAEHEDRSWGAGRNYLGFRLAHPPDTSP
jgi:formylglycine-generating enzyme required for sulfatase activity